jgi:hypothetical protein
MNREVHVRFWERPEVKALRATRQTRPSSLGPHVRFRQAQTLVREAGLLGVRECCSHCGAGCSGETGEWLYSNDYLGHQRRGIWQLPRTQGSGDHADLHAKSRFCGK